MDAVYQVEVCTEEEARDMGILTDGEIMQMWMNLAYVTMSTGDVRDPAKVYVCDNEHEARNLAAEIWADLSGEDRAMYMDRTRGAMFVIEARTGDNTIEVVADWSDLLPDVDMEALEILVDDCLARDDYWPVQKIAKGGDAYHSWLGQWFGPEGCYINLADLQSCGFVDADEARDSILEIIRDKCDYIESVDCIKKITRGGNSLNVSITKEAEALGIGQGDYVKITIKRA